MTASLVIGGRRVGPIPLVFALLGLAVVVALITPEPPEASTGGRSSFSAAPGGARMVYELAQRMGWQASRRDAPMDSIATRERTVQVVLAPEDALGAVEVHRLLENVRGGGGLIFDVDDGQEIADSLGIELGPAQEPLFGVVDSACPKATSLASRAALVLPPTIHSLRWRRPPPGVVATTTVGERDHRNVPVESAFSLGAGTVVALASSALMSNAIVRTCTWDADVSSARALESVWPAGALHPRVVFDEYHHGYGAHGGSLHAVSLYLARTPSGHFLAQALIAALILLLARAPRPIVPRDPERVPRRSPLEHADALARAYSDVAATRTATSLLVGGLRRRIGRAAGVTASPSDSAFLDGVEQRAQSLAPSARVLRRALAETLPRRELAAVAIALQDIEQHLSTTPPPRS